MSLEEFERWKVFHNLHPMLDWFTMNEDVPTGKFSHADLTTLAALGVKPAKE